MSARLSVVEVLNVNYLAINNLKPIIFHTFTLDDEHKKFVGERILVLAHLSSKAGCDGIPIFALTSFALRRLLKPALDRKCNTYVCYTLY